MHWEMDEYEMARRANTVPFTAPGAGLGEQSGRQLAQQDRMLESTSHGRDLQTLGSHFNRIKSNGYSHRHSISSGDLPDRIAPIKNEHSFPGYDEDDSDNDSDEENTPRVRNVGAEIRLPGVAALDGEIAAFEIERRRESTTGMNEQQIAKSMR